MKPVLQSAGDVRTVRLFVCLLVYPSPMRTCRPLADWHSSKIVLAAIAGTVMLVLGHVDNGWLDISSFVKNTS